MAININRVKKYLYPCIYKYQPKLIKLINSFDNVTIYYKDAFEQDLTNCIFLKVKYSNRNKPIIDTIRQSMRFVKSYLYSDISTKEYIIVLSLHKDCEEAYNAFSKGEYSKMFTREQTQYLLSNKFITHKVYDVLNKTDAGKKEFISVIEKEYGVDMKGEYDGEYDFKPNNEDRLI